MKSRGAIIRSNRVAEIDPAEYRESDPINL